MRIIYLQNSEKYHTDVLDTFRRMKIELSVYRIPDSEDHLMKAFGAGDLNELAMEMKEGRAEAVFGLNYSACIAELCRNFRIIYVSWLLNPPFSDVYSATAIYETNRIFIADKYLADLFQMQGVNNIYYLPAGVNMERCQQAEEGREDTEVWDAAVADTIFQKRWHELFQTKNLKDATLGYLEGIMTCQNLVYGYDFYQRPMPEYVLEDLKKNSGIAPANDSVESLADYYAEQCFYPKTTEKDRVIGVKTLEKAGLHTYYFSTQIIEGNNIVQQSPISFEEQLSVYARTKINLCIAPRGIRDGIARNVLYAMAMGALVITDDKLQLHEKFELGNNVVTYENLQDLLDKAKYYYTHEDERKQIAENARRKIAQEHTLELRILQIIEKI